MGSDNSKKTFASKIKYYMEENEVTRKEVMKELNVKDSTFSSWCSAKKMPRMETLKKLAAYFRVDISDLTEEKDPDTKPCFHLTEREKRLMSYYRKLNNTGRQKLTERAGELIALGFVEKSQDKPDEEPREE
ncbi:MAG: helix-turn-helix transcriptional regulator [Lachnospiraceae bacterium]|nr:helix-turn-helix transcriptional regulator [Lachnospiraceae bacterium]